MAAAHRHLVAKALAELSHERLLVPVEEGEGWWSLAADGEVTYRFRARLLPLEHWLVDPVTVTRLEDGVRTGIDAQRFVLDVRSRLPLPEATVPVYLEEIASTLAGRCWKDRPEAPTSAGLLEASFQEIEAAMTEGHPCFVANNGRLGWSAADHLAYAPETAAPVALVWLAVRRSRSVLALADDLGYEDLLAEELDPEVRAGFDQRLADLGLEAEDYLLMPCHPWQWEHKIAITYAPDVARRDIVRLGTAPDDYQAQQSVRTFYNRSRPERRYVKTALSVLNMGFLRGLSPAYMEHTPAINDWVAALVTDDETLQRHGFSVLREVAAVGYTQPSYAACGSTPYTKMLAALWRETPQVADGERLASMTSLLHVDAKGTPYAAALVEASGLEPEAWLRAYLDAYLVPVLHAFYAHHLVFMPHGENVILVLRDHVPVRVVMKDIGEEVAVLSPSTPLPPGVERIRADVPEELQLLSVHTDVVDCFLRFLSGVLDEAGTLPAEGFWAEVARCARDYQAAHPALAGRFAEHDLFAETFARSCLNRLQLRNNQQMVDLADPASALAIEGVLENPLAGR
ncbi:IucA/IucC family siderophore biosynthesis protein [Nocardioides mangrovicus]|uniref:IucA/IucC family siderophore biosynthesis protein n=2 Tax=Nocardioides mangrovicus TaxID=2478913 RepID=A0A3L8P563_9ACTN|nr:IucA/IucC family siderophore biosynthesis protein [Nocardioides mangrovicus]